MALAETRRGAAGFSDPEAPSMLPKPCEVRYKSLVSSFDVDIAMVSQERAS